VYSVTPVPTPVNLLGDDDGSPADYSATRTAYYSLQQRLNSARSGQAPEQPGPTAASVAAMSASPWVADASNPQTVAPAAQVVEPATPVGPLPAGTQSVMKSAGGAAASPAADSRVNAIAPPEANFAAGPEALVSSRRTFGGEHSTPIPAQIEMPREGPPTRPVASGEVLFSRGGPVLSVDTLGPRTIIVGKEATYQVTMRNAGDVAAQDVVVQIKIPEWTEVVSAEATSGAAALPASLESGEPLVWTMSHIDRHSTESLTLRLVPRKSRLFDLAVQWTFSPVRSQTLVEVQEPKLALALAGPDEVSFGQSKLYRLTISNPGTGDAEGVMIHLAPLNEGGSPTRHAMGVIRAGESKVVEIELTARQSGSLTIKASATAEGGLQAAAEQQVLVRRAALELAVDAAHVKYTGAAANYVIRLANAGNAVAETVQITATLPTGAKYVSSSGGQLSADQRKVTWNLPLVRPGAEASFELKCILNTPGANRLQAAATGAGDLSDVATATTQVEAVADLKLEMIDPRGPISVGDDAVYEIQVRNRGTKSAEQIDVLMYFADGVEPVGAEGGPHDITSGQVVFRPLASLAAGGEAHLKVRARADRGGPHLYRVEVTCNMLGSKLVAEGTTLFYSPEAEQKARADGTRGPAQHTSTRGNPTSPRSEPTPARLAD
jgi:uncharacterized repeat protein (TIGR01451 family)